MEVVDGSEAITVDCGVHAREHFAQLTPHLLLEVPGRGETLTRDPSVRQNEVPSVRQNEVASIPKSHVHVSNERSGKCWWPVVHPRRRSVYRA